MHFIRRFFLYFLLLTTFAAAGRAVTVDWDALTWTPGTLNNSYDIDPAVAGNDVTVNISGDTGQLRPSTISPFPQTPALTKDEQGGLSVPENTLTLRLDLVNQTQSVTIMVDFSSLYTQGVSNVSFTIFDVDFTNSGGSFQDQLRSITALSIDGVTLIAPTITTSAANTLTGTGLSQVVSGTATSPDTGAGSGNGNVTISFGPAAIRSFTFIYGSGTATTADPTSQKIGIHDISFTPVPEINPAWTAVCSCLAAAALILRHSAKFRK